MNKVVISFVCIICLVVFSGCPAGTEDSSSSGGSSGSSNGSNSHNTLLTHDSMVSNAGASHYTRAKSISISWTTVKGVEKYKVYRYSGKREAALLPGLLEYADSQPAVVKEVTLYDSYVDDSSEFDKPFFYRISCVKDGAEGEKSDFIYGVCGADADVQEPENDSQASSTAGSSVFNSSDPSLVLYALPDGNDSVVTDADWYKYKGELKAFTVTIKPDSSNLVNYTTGDACLEFYYGGAKRASYPVQSYRGAYTFGDDPAHYGEAAGSGQVDVYYRLVFVHTDTEHKKIFKYKIEL